MNRQRADWILDAGAGQIRAGILSPNPFAIQWIEETGATSQEWPLYSSFLVSMDRREIHPGFSKFRHFHPERYVLFENLNHLLDRNSCIPVGGGRLALQRVVRKYLLRIIDEHRKRGFLRPERIFFLHPQGVSAFYKKQVVGACIALRLPEPNFISFPVALIESLPTSAFQSRILFSIHLGDSSFSLCLFQKDSEGNYHFLAGFKDESLHNDAFNLPLLNAVQSKFGYPPFAEMPSPSDSNIQPIFALVEELKREIYRTGRAVGKAVEIHLSEIEEQWVSVCTSIHDSIRRLAKAQNMEKETLPALLFYGDNSRNPVLQRHFHSRFTEINFFSEPHHKISPQVLLPTTLAPSGFRLPFAVGMEIDENNFYPFFSPHRDPPFRKRLKVAPVFEAQEAISLRLFAGNSSRTEENFFLGSFDFFELKRFRRGNTHLIDLFLELSKEGILQITLASRAAMRAETFVLNLATLVNHLRDNSLLEQYIRTERVTNNSEAFQRPAEQELLQRHLERNALALLESAEEALYNTSHLFSLSRRVAIEHAGMLLESALAVRDSEMIRSFMLELKRLIPPVSRTEKPKQKP